MFIFVWWFFSIAVVSALVIKNIEFGDRHIKDYFNWAFYLCPEDECADTELEEQNKTSSDEI